MSSKGKFSLGVAVIAFGLALLLAPAAQADLYWTTTPGSLTPGDGVWDTDSFWATDGAGNGIGTWVDSSVADFNADSSPTSTITINSAVNASGVTFNGAGYTVTGGQLNLVGAGIVTANQDATIFSAIGGSVGLTLNGSGVVTLGGVNTYTGATVLNGGTLKLGGSPPAPSAGLVAEWTFNARRPTGQCRRTGNGKFPCGPAERLYHESVGAMTSAGGGLLRTRSQKFLPRRRLPGREAPESFPTLNTWTTSEWFQLPVGIDTPTTEDLSAAVGQNGSPRRLSAITVPAPGKAIAPSACGSGRSGGWPVGGVCRSVYPYYRTPGTT